MTLIEIIIVVALLGTLMAYLASNLIGRSDEARKDEARLAMGVLDQSLELYHIHNNHYPTTEEGLAALVTRPDDLKTWRGPYTEQNKLSDPWGQPFGYEATGASSYTLTSAGPDQKIGTADDISSASKTAGEPRS